MKNKIVLTFMVLSLSIMLFGCGNNPESEMELNSSNKVEETYETSGTNANNSELKTEEQNTLKYDFEGKYWVAYEAEYSLGYYFDGTNLTACVTTDLENVNITPYSVKNGLILLDEYEYSYQVEDGSLSLVASDNSMDIYCVEVEKAEFDSLFSEGNRSEETPTTEEETEQVTETPTEETTTDEVGTEVENNYTYDFEGRYWKSDDGYSAIYFDGTNYISKYNGGDVTNGKYTVDSEYMMIWLDGLDPLGTFKVSGSTLSLSGEWDTFMYTEITKEEFEKLFN